MMDWQASARCFASRWVVCALFALSMPLSSVYAHVAGSEMEPAAETQADVQHETHGCCSAKSAPEAPDDESDRAPDCKDCLAGCCMSAQPAPAPHLDAAIIDVAPSGEAVFPPSAATGADAQFGLLRPPIA